VFFALDGVKNDLHGIEYHQQAKVLSLMQVILSLREARESPVQSKKSRLRTPQENKQRRFQIGSDAAWAICRWWS
jgi:hypothetical protein